MTFQTKKKEPYQRESDNRPKVDIPSNPILQKLSSEPDIAVWNTVFDSFAKANDTDTDVVEIIFDRGANEHQINQIYVPKLLNPEDEPVVRKYIATRLNNRCVLRGAKQIFISAGWCRQIKDEVMTNYRQVPEMIFENFGTAVNEIIQPIPPGYAPPQPAPAPEEEAQKSRQSGPVFGIDIGNTTTKLVILNNQDLPVYQDTVPTRIDEHVRAEEFLEWLKSLIIEAINQRKSSIRSIGLSWFGDVREQRALMQAASLRHFVRDGEDEVLAQMGDIISKRLKVPVVLTGDSEALGIFLSRQKGFTKNYTLIFGTSIGGSYINADGRYDGVSLPSRLIIEMSDKAFAHEATSTRGVLQQYAASRGMTRLLQEIWLADLGNFPRNVGKYLDECFASNDTERRTIASRVVGRLAEYLGRAIQEVSRFYEVDCVILTGTSMSGKLGEAICQTTHGILSERYSQSQPDLLLADFD